MAWYPAPQNIPTPTHKAIVARIEPHGTQPRQERKEPTENICFPLKYQPLHKTLLFINETIVTNFFMKHTKPTYDTW